MKRRTVNVFSLSLLDCISCGLGAVILLFVIVNAGHSARRDEKTAALRAESRRLRQELIENQRRLDPVRNALERVEEEEAIASDRARQLIQEIQRDRRELATLRADTLARREHVNRLKSDLKSLDEAVRRLAGGRREAAERAGERLRPFPGQGDRHYLTDLKMGGRRILLLVDASASMLADTVVDVLRVRNMSDARRRSAAKWRHALSAADWLLARLPAESRFQVYAFNEKPFAVVSGSGGSWLDAGDPQALERAADGLHRLVPQKGTSLLNALETAGNLKPAPDNVFVLTDGLPTMGAKPPWSRKVSSRRRMTLFNQAVARMGAGAPVNVILYPMEGDPHAASAFWRLAVLTGGSFFCPAGDWP